MKASTPAALLELATAHQRSHLVLALIELDIPTRLADGPRAAEHIAHDLDADPLAVRRLLDAAVALGVLARAGACYRNAPDTQRYLVRGGEAYLGGLFRRHERVASSTTWAECAERLRAWRPGFHETMSTDGAPAGDEVEGQHRLGLAAGQALGAALRLADRRRLLDLGGGTGAMAIALCRRHPELGATIVERPAIVPLARASVAASGLGDRIAVVEGDFVTDELPDDPDVVLLANVLSMLSADTTRDLFRRLHERLPKGALVVVSGWMLNHAEHRSLLPMLLSIEDILLGAPDVERAAETYAEWLSTAGFVAIERALYFDPVSFVSGRK